MPRGRRIVDAAACSVSRKKRSQAITALWSAWRSSADRNCAHEVLDVEPVGAPGAGALLLPQPDLFFGNVGQALERRDPAVAGVDRYRQVGGVVHHREGSWRLSYEINWIIT